MFWGLIETKAEKELKELTAKVAAKAIEDAKIKAAAEAEANREITLVDVQTVVTKYGQKVLTQAKEVSSELLTEAGNKTAEVKNTVVEKFNEQSGKLAVNAVEVAFTVSKAVDGLKKKIAKKLGK